MIKKVKNSLTAKVFCITSLLLCIVSILVFCFIAWLVPETYSANISAELEQRTRGFISSLENVTFEKSKGLFSNFVLSNDVTLRLYNENGNMIALPSDKVSQDLEVDGSSPPDVVTNASETGYTNGQDYYFHFSGNPSVYKLTVYSGTTAVNQVIKSLKGIIPYLVIAIILISAVGSVVYSIIVTRPVLQISEISEKMSTLNFDWHCAETRNDELGVLEKSLNKLSRKLVVTISDLQNANQKLSEDIEHEKAVEQSRLDFFSAVSHELKTPITIIKGQLEGMILGVGAYKDHEKYLSRSLEVANTLETLVLETLTISRLETANCDFSPEQFDCVPIIRAYINGTEDLIVEKELVIESDMPLVACIKGNKILMEKVFSNPIGNAIKHSPQGAIIDISVFANHDQITFSIENSGTHIPENSLSKVFEAFYRVEQSRSRKTGGSGLGLYIVQKILQQYGTRCLVCNTQSGVRFSFTI